MRNAILFLVLLCHVIAGAQTIAIKGVVIGADKGLVAGAVISVKGTAISTATNAKGAFMLGVKALPTLLHINAVGFDPVERVITAKDTVRELRIQLKASATALEEVVVTSAYSTRRHEVSFEGAATSPAMAMAGKVAGVRVAGAPAADATIRLRGIATGTAGYKKRGAAGVLTAGELSDFKKWKLWGDYSDADFRSYSEHWSLAPRHRYCVQVQSSNHRALAGEKVYLINADNRDTVWTAITDNTGKAELWAGIKGEATEQERFQIRCGGQVLRSPDRFESGINRIMLPRACDVSNIVDITFVVDATGSMGDEIAYLQNELQDIITKTANTHRDVELQLGSVFYRDHGDQYLTRYLPFSTDTAALQSFIDAQNAGGGGDGPEAVEAALTTALDSLHWSPSARARLLFLVLDAPPHDDKAEEIQALVRRAAAAGIRIVPVVCSGINKSTEYLMRAIALATNGSYVFLTDDSGVGEKHIKPTTDEFKVELLNALLLRVINEMLYMPSCETAATVTTVAPADSVAATPAKLTVFPNPTSGRVTIEAMQAIRELWVTDFAGKVLQKESGGNRKRRWTIDLGAYPAGTYFIKYFIENSGWSTSKVVVVH